MILKVESLTCIWSGWNSGPKTTVGFVCFCCYPAAQTPVGIKSFSINANCLITVCEYHGDNSTHLTYFSCFIVRRLEP